MSAEPIEDDLRHDTNTCAACRRTSGKKQQCFEQMDEAYDEASDGGALFVPARNMYYPVRRLTGLGDELDAHQFQNGAQSILNCYLREHAHTEDWSITRDPRGVFTPPHGGEEVPMGTLGVRDYMDAIDDHSTDLPSYLGFSLAFPKAGPGDNFNQILYVEKEGFSQLIASAGLQDRYDLAVCSSKGYSNDATRNLLLALHERFDVPIYVAHDLDKDGINIAAMIKVEGIEIIDFGIRWDDVIDPRWGPVDDKGNPQNLTVNSEPVAYWASGGKGKPRVATDPRPHLASRGATPDEIAYLCSTTRPKGTHSPNDPGDFSGRRIELNALVGRTFIDWLQDKLDTHGVGKLVPDADVLDDAYRRAYALGFVNASLPRMLKRGQKAAALAELPDDLETLVSEALDEDPEQTWDDVIADLVREAMP